MNTVKLVSARQAAPSILEQFYMTWGSDGADSHTVKADTN
jgi:hypothetical protein